MRNTPRGVRTGASNLCRRSNLMGQYGRAALSVARTHKKRLLQTTVSTKKERAFTQIHTPPVSLSAATPLKEGGFIQRIAHIHTTNKRVHYTKCHSSTHDLTFRAARHREVLQELFSKSGFFAKLFYIKKRTYSHKQKPHSKYMVGLFYTKKVTPHITKLFTVR